MGYQQAEVYAWERAHIAPLDSVAIPFVKAPELIRYIWQKEGLRFPPRVTQLSKRSRWAGKATRTEVQLSETSYSWIILHELAHSLTTTFDGRCEAAGPHGPLFVGWYVVLLERYLGIPFPKMEATLKVSGVDLIRNPVPLFV